MEPGQGQDHATTQDGPGPGPDGTADVGVVCGSMSAAVALALLVAFVASRVSPPTHQPRLPVTTEVARPLVGPGPHHDDVTVPGSVSRLATPLAPARWDEHRGGHDLREHRVEARPLGTYAPPAPEVPLGLVARLQQALGKSRAVLQERFDRIFGNAVDESLFESLEEALLTADVGMPTTERIVARVRDRARGNGASATDLRAVMREEMRNILHAQDPALRPPPGKPWVILVVGVNGSGKTTTIGKLAARFVGQGKRVMLAAGDTYRAAAADQLQIWSERAGADLVRGGEGADPGAVVFDALGSALARGHDVVIIDTAGRLQTAKPLMEQLGKVRRVIAKQVADGPHETLLVLDGTMGQNGLSQAQLFNEATPLTGVVVTKLDGTAKGGMVLTIAAEMQLAVKLIGIGEAVEDLRDFDPSAFVEALA